MRWWSGVVTGGGCTPLIFVIFKPISFVLWRWVTTNLNLFLRVKGRAMTVVLGRLNSLVIFVILMTPSIVTVITILKFVTLFPVIQR